MAQLAASVVLFSSTWPLTKCAMTAGAAPLWFAEGRALLSGMTAFAYLAATRRLTAPVRADMPALFGVGLLQLACFFALSHAAVAWVPAGRTAVLASTTTIWIAPLSVLVLHEAIPSKRWIAAAVSLAGVAILLGPWAIDWTAPESLIGHGFLLGASLGWSLAIIIVRRIPPHSSMLQLLPWCFGVAAVALLPLAIAHGHGHILGRNPAAWGSLAYIGTAAGPVGTWCVLQASATLPAMVSSMGFLMTPALGLMLSNWFLGERLTPDLLAGSALIFVGAGAAAWPGRAR